MISFTSQNCYIKCTTTQIINHKGRISFFIREIEISISSSLRFRNNSTNIQTCDLSRQFCQISFILIKIRRNCYHSISYITSRISFHFFSDCWKNHSTNILRMFDYISSFSLNSNNKFSINIPLYIISHRATHFGNDGIIIRDSKKTFTTVENAIICGLHLLLSKCPNNTLGRISFIISNTRRKQTRTILVS